MLYKSVIAMAVALPLGAIAQSSNVTFTEKIEGFTFIKSGPKEANLAPRIRI